MTDAVKETHGFKTEVKQLLHLMINALYSNEEIFLRELISNAADAADKLRFEGIKNSSLYEDDSDLAIFIEFNKEDRTITISDNGIGMSRDEVVENLGTIARSGTQEFMNKLTGDQAKDRHLIGQFGVGFYSSFIIADKVTVNTRRAGVSPEEGVSWVSEGQGEYSIETINKKSRGTQIIMHLKEGKDEFLDEFRLRTIVGKYSDHINIPVKMNIEEEVESEAKDGKEAEKTKTIREEVVNKATALWTVPKSDLSDEEYQEFYKHVAHDFDDALAWAHNRVEGKLEYTTLLYIPKRAPFDLYQASKPRGLKLYVKRVFIMDDAEQFLPNYLRFVRGVIDSNDLPLNISREILQSNRTVDTIRGSVVKRVLDTLKNIAKTDSDQYAIFWREFGQVIKEGPAEDFANRESILELLRFSSTKAEKEEQTVSLQDYFDRVPEGQKKIYYIAAETFNAARHSPHLEVFKKKGIEVLIMFNRIDEWLMSHLTDFKGKPFQSIAMGDLEELDFATTESEQDKEAKKKQSEEIEKEFSDMLVKIKDKLGDKVAKVRMTERLTTSPSCIVAESGQMTSQMERIMRSAGQEVNVKPILELNPDHVLVKRLQQESDQTLFDDLSHILLDQAILAEGGLLDDPASFIKKFNELVVNISK
jgi:molecular chaperone HtpG